MPLQTDSYYEKPPYENDFHVYLYENNNNVNYPFHWHTAVEIIMPLKGTYEIQTENNTYLLKESDILIIPSTALHAINVPPKSEKGERLIMLFEPRILYSLPCWPINLLGIYNTHLITSTKNKDIHEKVYELLINCINENRKTDKFHCIVIYIRIIEIFILLAQIFIDDSKQSPKRHEYILQLNSAFKYIDENYNKKITLEQVAKCANMSKFHFTRIFKKYSNITFYQYLTQKRIIKAETMLLDSKKTILDIAMENGFNSVATFNKTFKEIKKYTPSDYRKFHRTSEYFEHSHN
jgi:AraC-like DNA-binding protein